MDLAYSFVSIYSFFDALEKIKSEDDKQYIVCKGIQDGFDLLYFDLYCKEDIRWLQFPDDNNLGIALCFFSFELFIDKAFYTNPLFVNFKVIPSGIHIIPSLTTFEFLTKANTKLKGLVMYFKKDWIDQNNYAQTLFYNINDIISIPITTKQIIDSFQLLTETNQSDLHTLSLNLLKYVTKNKMLLKVKKDSLYNFTQKKKIEEVTVLLSHDIYSINFDYKDIARVTNIGYQKLKREFIRYYGIDLYTYRQMLRMKKAFECLQLGFKKNEVAINLGYKGRTNQFTHHFKKIYGYSPECIELSGTKFYDNNMKVR